MGFFSCFVNRFAADNAFYSRQVNSRIGIAVADDSGCLWHREHKRLVYACRPAVTTSLECFLIKSLKALVSRRNITAYRSLRPFQTRLACARAIFLP